MAGVLGPAMALLLPESVVGDEIVWGAVGLGAAVLCRIERRRLLSPLHVLEVAMLGYLAMAVSSAVAASAYALTGDAVWCAVVTGVCVAAASAGSLHLRESKQSLFMPS